MDEKVLKDLREKMDIGVRYAMLTYSNFINIDRITCAREDIDDITALIKRAGFRLVTSSIFDHEQVSFYASICVDEEDEIAYDPLAEEQLGISARTFRDNLMTKVRIQATEVITYFNLATYRGGKGLAEKWRILATNLAPIVKREVIKRLESDGFTAKETVKGNDGFIVVGLDKDVCV